MIQQFDAENQTLHLQTSYLMGICSILNMHKKEAKAK